MFLRHSIIVFAAWIILPAPAPAQTKDVTDALERGDAARAIDIAKKALAVENSGSDAQRAGYIAAVAAGDAQLAESCLKKLADQADGDEKTRISRRRQWLVRVGKEAPDVPIACEDDTSIKVANRGDKVLVIDFWNVLAAPSKESVAALKKLHAGLKDDRNVEFVGVNADAATRLEKARAFAKTSGFAWPQCYEKQAGTETMISKAFTAGDPPWTVLIDSYGNIRAVGAADETGFRYAVKTAVAEARGDFDPLMPRTRDGQQAAKPGSRGELAKAAEKAAAEKPAKKEPASGELPSNPDARAKFQTARTFWKAFRRADAKKLFQEIVRDYPGTLEAKEAQEFLD